METKTFDYKLKINSAGKTYCAPDWSWDTLNHNWNDFDLWTVVGGKGHLQGEDKTYELMAGDCFLLRSDERYMGIHDKHNPLVVIHIHYNYVDSTNSIIHPKQPPKLYRRINELSFFGKLLDRVLHSYNTNKSDAHAWLHAALLEIDYQDRQDSYSGLELEQASIIDGICSKVKIDPGRYNNIENIKSGLSYSNDHFIRLFRKYKGMTPYEYVLENKIEAAKTLLLTSSHSISRISHILGYADVYHFSKQFKERTGTRPSQYRGNMTNG